MTSGWFTHPPASEPSDHTLEPWSLCAVLGSRDVTRAAWRSHHPSVLRLVMFFLQNILTYPSKVCPQGRQRVNVYHPWMVSDNAKTHLALNDFECIAMVYLQRGMNQDIYIYIQIWSNMCISYKAYINYWVSYRSAQWLPVLHVYHSLFLRGAHRYAQLRARCPE